jgi:hypothetical protein
MSSLCTCVFVAANDVTIMNLIIFGVFTSFLFGLNE